jgi:hypothetical protein
MHNTKDERSKLLEPGNKVNQGMEITTVISRAVKEMTFTKPVVRIRCWASGEGVDRRYLIQSNITRQLGKRVDGAQTKASRPDTINRIVFILAPNPGNS